MTSEEVFTDDHAIEQTSDNLFALISPSESLPARPASYLPARGGGQDKSLMEEVETLVEANTK